MINRLYAKENQPQLKVILLGQPCSVANTDLVNKHSNARHRARQRTFKTIYSKSLLWSQGVHDLKGLDTRRLLQNDSALPIVSSGRKLQSTCRKGIYPSQYCLMMTYHLPVTCIHVLLTTVFCGRGRADEWTLFEGFVGRENRFPCFLDPHPLSRCDTWIYNICSVQQDSQVALVVKNPPAKAGDFKRYRFDPWVGKIP